MTDSARPGRRVGLTALGIVLIAGFAAAIALGVGRHGSSAPDFGTSLKTFDPHGDALSLPGGGIVTDGMELLQLSPGKPAIRITDVRLVNAHDMQLVGAAVAGPDRKLYQFTVAHGFPSHSGTNSTPASGTVITEASRGWNLLVGVKAGAHGFPVFHGVEVIYTSQGSTYRQILPGVVVVCADAQSSADRCNPPASLKSPAPTG